MGTGKATFTYAFAGHLPPGEQVVTATATDASGDTSEFSNGFYVSRQHLRHRP